ncbi:MULTISPECIES: hypothetical protein [unclassified Gilliamella]|uniref:hypothetical protein n=1 Tax=unclassified Gilliamella TaxID=2685620 RepID=UPI000A34684A|nr:MULTISPECIES: hypothetical protein [unclassified Gilliamella]OTQ73086.1 hypothetical protein B6C99_09315 [Gilliamella sp. N-G2]OTQ79819.1 hypothetical protein B6D23_04125 [Gilliamella sp. N-W3]
MKISNILTYAIVSILAAGCVKNNTSSTNGKIEVDQLTILKQRSEQNNPFVVNAKKQLLQLVGDNHFDSYITKHGILNCKDDSNQSSCVLNFYLNQYYKLKYDIQLKKVIEENQAEHKIELTKINPTEGNVKNYCQWSADFVEAVYTNDIDNINIRYQPLFKMSVQDMATLKAKILKDNYSHFLIDENPSILQEMRADFMEKCLSSPKDNIINYINIFR